MSLRMTLCIRFVVANNGNNISIGCHNIVVWSHRPTATTIAIVIPAAQLSLSSAIVSAHSKQTWTSFSSLCCWAFSPGAASLSSRASVSSRRHSHRTTFEPVQDLNNRSPFRRRSCTLPARPWNNIFSVGVVRRCAGFVLVREGGRHCAQNPFQSGLCIHRPVS